VLARNFSTIFHQAVSNDFEIKLTASRGSPHAPLQMSDAYYIQGGVIAGEKHTGCQHFDLLNLAKLVGYPTVMNRVNRRNFRITP
jgi:hypothetical protein